MVVLLHIIAVMEVVPAQPHAAPALARAMGPFACRHAILARRYLPAQTPYA